MTTDYGKINGIVLSYPQGFHDPFYNKLAGFYEELIGILPVELEVSLIVRSERAENHLNNRFPDRSFNFITIRDFNEIWLRDLLGFPNGKSVIKPIFHPTYFKNIYTGTYLNKIDSQINSILLALGFDVVPVDLVWDGGNLIHNNKIGFITDKLIKDNPAKSESEIRKAIEDVLEISPVIVPTAKHDQLGHIDGYMNFIREDVITLSNYPVLPFLKESKAYRESLSEQINQEGLHTVDIWDRPYLENITVGNESLESSRGIYNNFLQANDTIILPSYKLPKESTTTDCLAANINSLEKYFSTIRIINSDQLAKLGGVLHCVSWCW